MFSVSIDTLNDRVNRYKVLRDGKVLTYSDVLGLWQSEAAFRQYFIGLLADAPFTAYRWETPPITGDTVGREFEFVLIDSPHLARAPDRMSFAAQFAAADKDGIAVFENLGKDAVLVVPAPRGPDSSYDQLAAFLRNAPELQKHALWRVVGHTVQRTLSNRPLWVSTAGGGVAWLHVRLDVRPKYYGYEQYKHLLTRAWLKPHAHLRRAALNFVGFARRIFLIRPSSTASFSLPGAARACDFSHAQVNSIKTE